MRSLALATALLFAVTACGAARADDAAGTGKTCATNASSNAGKPLTGAARTSSIKKCCETGAVGSDGKPLVGAAKNSFMKACLAAGG